jgi:hypothetical protein
MVALTRLSMSDISRQKRFETDLTDLITPRHTVGQAVDRYVERMRIPSDGVRYSVFSRGVKLDNKQSLAELPEEDCDWTVMAEVSAG